MRICLVSHGFPPSDRTGVENYTEALARALARRGHAVDVFAPRRDPDAGHLSVRLEERDGFSVHWIALNRDPEDPVEALDSLPVARQFGRFLDRERPELVHFQHVIKLGVGCLHEAHERGLPVVYTAHDYFAVCHRYTLLRPDLHHCDVRGDSMACARCDLALGYLNGIPGLGDYQAGVFPDQLGAQGRATLEGILEDDAARSGISDDESDAAFDRRLDLDARRARAFAAVDLFLAPSERMRDELVRGGIERERIELLAYGIPNDDLGDLPPPATDEGRPVRFGYFGGHSKQKGVHVLLEAFGRLDAPAELVVHGYATDEPYGELVRELASRNGALLRGAYERPELPGLLAEVDVVVVPSTWVENQPIVIREAFSAGRPVITSRFGAMPESVRDEVDGLLFEVGDAADLARVLRRSSDHALVRELAGNIRPVKDIDTQAAELLERYEALRARSEPEPEVLPSSLAGFAARYHELDRLPSRELFSRVLGGLERLRAGLSESPLDALLEDALARGSKVQTAVRDGVEEQAWLKDLVARKQEERDYFRELADEKEGERASLAAERDWLRQTLEERDTELEWLRDTSKERDEELEWLRGKVAELERGRAELAAALASIETSVEEKDRELRSTAELGLAALAAQERAVRDELAGLPRSGSADGRVAEGFEGLLASIQDAVHHARRLREELDWRRGEMAGAVEASRRRMLHTLLRRTGLGRRLSAWESDDDAEVQP